MGDAGPPTPVLLSQHEGRSSDVSVGGCDSESIREIRVLVTGFGPFKSFLINPSWLIVSALPEELYASIADKTTSPACRIRLICHPSPVRVSYATVSEQIPELIAQHSPDLILHIGMAGGRDCYSLETRAHRSHYRIKDVDDADGRPQEEDWQREGVPDVLYVGWDEGDVLKRWETNVQQGLAERGFLGRAVMERSLCEQKTYMPASAARRKSVQWDSESQQWPTSNIAATPAKVEEHKKKSCVKLSTDAGRFLCEYIFFESLSRRWLQFHKSLQRSRESVSSSSDNEDSAKETLGRVAFLHVPGWTGVEDINRGVMIAEQAIRALVDSWEEGFRRGGNVKIDERAYTTQHSEEKGKVART
jgi:pyrrolidone-carboxylate peptidase